MFNEKITNLTDQELGIEIKEVSLIVSSMRESGQKYYNGHSWWDLTMRESHLKSEQNIREIFPKLENQETTDKPKLVICSTPKGGIGTDLENWL